MTPQETVLEITLGIIKAQIESMERKIDHLERETIAITRQEVSGYLERIRKLLRDGHTNNMNGGKGPK